MINTESEGKILDLPENRVPVDLRIAQQLFKKLVDIDKALDEAGDQVPHLKKARTKASGGYQAQLGPLN